MARVAILVPGIMGSELYLGNELVWPGPARSLLLPYRKMEQLLTPGLEAKDVIRSYFFSTQYQGSSTSWNDGGFMNPTRPLPCTSSLMTGVGGMRTRPTGLAI